MTAPGRVRRAVQRARDARWSGARADHVGLLDATTLWFSATDVPAGARLAFRGADGTTDLGVAAAGDGLVATLDLSPYAGQAAGPHGLELVVVTAGGQVLPVRPAFMAEPGELPTVAPPLPGDARAWRLETRPAVRLRTVEVPSGVPFRSPAVVDDELVVRLDLPAAHPGERPELGLPAAHLVAPDGRDVPLPLEPSGDGWVLRLGVEHLTGLEVPHVVRVRIGGRDLPVVREWRDLRAAGRGVPLPMLSGAGTTYALVELGPGDVLSARLRAVAEGLT